MERDNQPTLTERVAKLEAVILDRGEPHFVGRQFNAEEELREAVDRQRIIEGEGCGKFEPASSFEEIMNRVQGCTDRVCATASKLETIGDRIFGIRPESNEGTQKAASPEGMFEHTLLALDWLDESIMRLQRAAGRIERV